FHCFFNKNKTAPQPWQAIAQRFCSIGSCRGEVMKRSELESFIMETYNAGADYPWLKYPNYEVFRHCNNRKWFALIMDVPKNKLGLQGEEVLEVVNFKCDPILIGTLREEPGFFPAYHMSKDSWITVALDGSVSDDKIKMLLDTSYEATASKTHKKMLTIQVCRAKL
ncbi:MmcQ/YjbR family DNA-binding protein, partial [Faecalicatena fissicatena]